MSEVISEIPVVVEAALNYLEPTGVRPATYTFEPPPGVPERTGVYRERYVEIVNARVSPPAGGLSLDRNGFELHAHKSAVDDFSDASVIESIYYREAQDLLKRATGASKVVIFDHTLRDGSIERRTTTGVREPVKYIHNDQTFVSGPRRVRDHLPPDEAERRLKGRYAIVNLWRPIGEPVESTPLALCDSRSIDVGDVVASDLIYPDKIGETYAFHFNPAHRWYYFPDLTPDEVLLLKIYDSAETGTARLTAHTAFDDPRSPVDAKPRRSIELRALVFFGEPGA